MDYFEHSRRVQHVKAREGEGGVADDIETRKALLARVHSGEMTLEAAQAELKRIQRGAKASGKVTRAQAYRGR